MVAITGRYRRAGRRGRHVDPWETRLVSAVSPPEPAGGQTNQARLATAVALHQQGRLTEAEALYRDILRRDPNHFDALHLCGVAALQARRTAEGVALVRDAIALHASVAEAHGNLANGLRELRRFEEALPSFDRAIALKPSDAQLHRDRAMTLQNLGRHAEALAGLADAVALQPDLEFAPGMIVHTRMLMCDWDGLDRDLAALTERIARGDKAAMPFTVIAWSELAAPATSGRRDLCARQVPGECHAAADRPAPPA